MKTNPVKLPQGEKIDSLEFTFAIAKAVHPHLQDEKGMACVWRKLVTLPVLGPVPQFLTDKDRRDLEPLLPVHELHGRMSEEKSQEILTAYRQLPNRLPWEPIFIADSDIERNKDARRNAQQEHRDKLQKAFSAGEISAFNSSHVPNSRFGTGIYIRRQDAIQYLEKCGLRPASDLDGETNTSASISNNSLPETSRESAVDFKAPSIPQSEKKTQKRHDALRPTIEDAQKLTNHPYSAPHIWKILLEMLEEQKYPLEADTPDGISWRASPEELNVLNLTALKARLYRYKKIRQTMGK